jgi:hypothetical protein
MKLVPYYFKYSHGLNNFIFYFLTYITIFNEFLASF